MDLKAGKLRKEGEKYFRKNQKNETYSNPLKTASWCLVGGCVYANIGFDLGEDICGSEKRGAGVDYLRLD
jgi:hypothetical protein